MRLGQKGQGSNTLRAEAVGDLAQNGRSGSADRFAEMLHDSSLVIEESRGTPVKLQETVNTDYVQPTTPSC